MPEETRGWFRMGVYKFIHTFAFEVFTITYVMVLFVMLAFPSLLENILASHFEIFATWVHLVSFYILTLEIVLKMIGLGLRGHNGFFNDLYCRLDLICWLFVLGHTWVHESIPPLVFLRILRVLRPLARVRMLHTSKVVVKTVWTSVKSMGEIIALMIFMIVLFGVLGINLFGLGGSNHQQCAVSTSFRYTTKAAMAYEVPCPFGDESCIPTIPELMCKTPHGGNLGDDPTNLGDPVCGSLPNQCVRFRQPVGDGINHFDHFGGAALAVLSVMLQKGWVILMYRSAESSNAIAAIAYYLVLCVFGSFCMLNLTVATTSQVYAHIKAHTNEKRDLMVQAEVAKEKLLEEIREKQRAAKGGYDDDEVQQWRSVPKATAWRYWLLGFIGCPWAHLLLLRDWWRFIPAVLTFNFLWVGWVRDGCNMTARVQAYNRKSQREFFEAEERKRDGPPAPSSAELNCAIFISRPYHEESSAIVQLAIDKGTYIPESERKRNRRKRRKGQSKKSKKKSTSDSENEEKGMKRSRSTVQLGTLDPALAEKALGALSDADDSNVNEHDGDDKDGAEGGHAHEHGPSYFEIVMDVCVGLNALAMGLEGFNGFMDMVLGYVEILFAVVFVIEAIIKIIGLGGFANYWAGGFNNRLDFFVVMTSTMGEILITIISAAGGAVQNLLILRATRVMRIGKLVRHAKGLKGLLARAFGGFDTVVYSIVVTFAFMMFYGMLGMELFRGKESDFESNNCRFTFEDSGSMMNLLFQFMTGDNYSNYMRAGVDAIGFLGIPYFGVFYIVVNYVFLRIFIAIILENFSIPDERRRELQIMLEQWEQMSDVDRNGKIDGKVSNRSMKKQFLTLKQNGDLPVDQLQEANEQWVAALALTVKQEAGRAMKDEQRIIYMHEQELRKKRERDELREQMEERQRKRERENFTAVFVRRVSRSRKNLAEILSSSAFEFIVLMVVLLSIVTSGGILTFDSGLQTMIDAVILLFFLVEMGVKMLIFGVWVGYDEKVRWEDRADVRALLRGEEVDDGDAGMDEDEDDLPKKPERKPAFLREVWNLIDAFVVGLMILSVIGGLPVGAFGALRIVRLLRPLKRMWPQLSILMNALSESWDEIAYVMMFLLLLFVFFSIFGMTLFRDRFASCTDVNATGYSACTGPAELLWEGQSMLAPRVWSEPSENFNNLALALRSLFRVLAQDGWGPIMYSAMDAPNIDSQPVKNQNPGNVLFFYMFTFVASVFASQLVIGVMVVNIRLVKGSALFTDAQKRWLDTKKNFRTLVDPVPLQRSKHPFRRSVQLIVTPKAESTAWFDHFMNTIIIINTLVMCMQSYPPNTALTAAGVYLSNVFISIYVIECTMKIIAFLPKSYIKDPWNAFDFSVVALSVIDSWILTSSTLNLSVFRLLRIVRIFRLVRRAKTLQFMIATLAFTVPSIGAALLFLFMYTFVFSAIGSNYFKYVKYGVFLEHHRGNFGDIGNALMLLFRAATGDDWFGLIDETSISSPYCTLTADLPKNLIGDCGHSWAIAYFFLFFVGCSYVFLPLFVATLIDYFFESNTDMNALVTKRNLEHYKEVWIKFQADDISPKMQLHTLRSFVDKLYDEGNPLGLRVQNEQERWKRVQVDIDIYNEQRCRTVPPNEHSYEAGDGDLPIQLIAKEMGLEDPRFMSLEGSSKGNWRCLDADARREAEENNQRNPDPEYTRWQRSAGKCPRHEIHKWVRFIETAKILATHVLQEHELAADDYVKRDVALDKLLIEVQAGRQKSLTNPANAPGGEEIMEQKHRTIAKVLSEVAYALDILKMQRTKIIEARLVQYRQLWERAYGNELQEMEGHKGGVTCIAVSPNGMLVATGGRDNTVRLWSAAKGKLMSTYADHEKAVLSVKFSCDDKQIISGGMDGRVVVWDTYKKDSYPVCKMQLHTGVVTCVDYSSKHNIVSASIDKTPIIWEAMGAERDRWTDARRLALPKSVKAGHKMVTQYDPIHRDAVSCVAFSPDGSRVVSGSHDRTVILWNVATGELLATHTGLEERIGCVAFSPDNECIAVGTIRPDNNHTHTHTSWPTPDGRNKKQALPPHGAVTIWRIRPQRNRKGGVEMGTVLATGGPAAITNGDDDDAANGAGGRDCHSHAMVVPDAGCSVHSGGASHVGSSVHSTSHKADLVADAGGSLLFELECELHGKMASSKQAHYVTSVAFSAENSRIVVGYTDGVVQLFNRKPPEAEGDLHTWEEACRLGGTGPVLRNKHKHVTTGVALDPAAMRVFSSSLDGTAKVWDIGYSTSPSDISEDFQAAYEKNGMEMDANVRMEEKLRIKQRQKTVRLGQRTFDAVWNRVFRQMLDRVCLKFAHKQMLWLKAGMEGSLDGDASDSDDEDDDFADSLLDRIVDALMPSEEPGQGWLFDKQGPHVQKNRRWKRDKRRLPPTRMLPAPMAGADGAVLDPIQVNIHQWHDGGTSGAGVRSPSRDDDHDVDESRVIPAATVDLSRDDESAVDASPRKAHHPGTTIIPRLNIPTTGDDDNRDGDGGSGELREPRTSLASARSGRHVKFADGQAGEPRTPPFAPPSLPPLPPRRSRRQHGPVVEGVRGADSNDGDGGDDRDGGDGDGDGMHAYDSDDDHTDRDHSQPSSSAAGSGFLSSVFGACVSERPKSRASPSTSRRNSGSIQGDYDVAQL